MFIFQANTIETWSVVEISFLNLNKPFCPVSGLSDSIIKKMTGASEKIIQGCLLQEDNELKQIINAKILMADWYYEF